jgi:hypothetical protein
MRDENRRLTSKELAALGIGIVVVIIVALITTRARPLLLPVSFLVSLTLGALAAYGALKILDPRTPTDLVEHEMNAQFRLMLEQLQEIASKTEQASRDSHLSTETSSRLAGIASFMGLIARRYQQRSRDFSGASSALLVFKEFDSVLAHYLRIKSGEQFLNEERKRTEIAQTETRILPMVETALENLGRQLDSGEVVDKKISEGTLESMLRSLSLIESLRDQLEQTTADRGDGP